MEDRKVGGNYTSRCRTDKYVESRHKLVEDRQLMGKNTIRWKTEKYVESKPTVEDRKVCRK